MVKRSFTVAEVPEAARIAVLEMRGRRHREPISNGLLLTVASRILTGGLRHLDLISATLQYLRFITA